MGNLCGKEATDPQAQNTRPLPSPSAPRPNQSSSVPRKVGGPPRTLGSSAPGEQSQEDARRKAAEAAEARAKATTAPKGKLGSLLHEQKKQSRADALNEVSRDERRRRDVAAAEQARVFD